MEKKLEDLGLKFGREFIAKNLNRYRMAEPTEDFWDFYKENKAELKAAGFSVYKHADLGFMVYDWRKTEKATQAEFDAQEKEREEYENQRLRFAIELLHHDVEERAAADEAVGEINSWEEFNAELARLYEHPHDVWIEYFTVNLPCNYFAQ
jgi:hypothetical protein